MDINNTLTTIYQSSNSLLAVSSVRIFILILSAVFIGYTLQPVPVWLSKLFDTSNVFKFIVLFFTGAVAFYPLTKESFLWIFISSLAILVLFNHLRTYDKEKFNNIKKMIFN